jgi:3-hydroxyacyl-[acyl-carrier-protein] dehydratase
MRWFWIDRFDAFVRAKSGSAVKNVSLSEDHLHDHFPGYAVMPNSLVVEGMAQTGGLIVADAIKFQKRVVLAKVSAAQFHRDAVPGDTILFDAKVLDLKPAGSLVHVTTRIADRSAARTDDGAPHAGEGVPQGEAELFFAHIDPGEGVPLLFEPEQFVRWLSQMRMYDIGVDEQGNRLEPPWASETVVSAFNGGMTGAGTFK